MGLDDETMEHLDVDADQIEIARIGRMPDA
jgi:hypothetical protein